MTDRKKLDRRQFVKHSAIATGTVAATSAFSSPTNACPVWFDDQGKIEDWFCIVDKDESNPIFTLYTWKNCRTGDMSQALGEPGEPLGDCGNAPSDDSCYKGIDMEEWDRFTVKDREYVIMPKTSGNALMSAISSLNRS